MKAPNTNRNFGYNLPYNLCNLPINSESAEVKVPVSAKKHKHLRSVILSIFEIIFDSSHHISSYV